MSKNQPDISDSTWKARLKSRRRSSQEPQSKVATPPTVETLPSPPMPMQLVSTAVAGGSLGPTLQHRGSDSLDTSQSSGAGSSDVVSKKRGKSRRRSSQPTLAKVTTPSTAEPLPFAPMPTPTGLPDLAGGPLGPARKQRSHGSQPPSSTTVSPSRLALVEEPP